MEMTTKYNMTPANLAERREIVSLSPREISVLRKLRPWAEKHANDISRDFYRHQFKCAGTLRFFEDFARQRGIPMEQLRQHLEGAHAGYLLSIFQEASGPDPFGTEYFNKRLHVGLVHNQINLPLKWYLGAYIPFSRAVNKRLRRSYAHRPFFRTRAIQAIQSVFNYDMQAVSDAFFIDLLDTLGVDTQKAVNAKSDRDITDELPKVKSLMHTLVRNLNDTSAELIDSSEQLAKSSEALRAQSQQQSQSLEQTAANIVQITEAARSTSENAGEANRLTAGEGEGANSVVQTMSKLQDSSAEISSITSLIEEIAFSSNLLALNAAVEAARAGEHGRGFGIVANEVGALAKRTGEAARQIKSIVDNSRQNVSEGVNSVERVAAMMAGIASSSTEQSHSIVDINREVEHLDNATRSNGQQVDLINDLAGRLAEQASSLSEIAKGFKSA